jgi:uncharacterized protein (DUF736 family)
MSVEIGKFKREAADLIGSIKTLGVQLDGVRFKHQDKGANYTIHGPDNVGELGVAWLKSGDFGDYLSVRLDCPTLPAPIHATMRLTPGEDGLFQLRWIRRNEPTAPRPASPVANLRSGG